MALLQCCRLIIVLVDVFRIYILMILVLLWIRILITHKTRTKVRAELNILWCEGMLLRISVNWRPKNKKTRPTILCPKTPALFCTFESQLSPPSTFCRSPWRPEFCCWVMSVAFWMANFEPRRDFCGDFTCATLWVIELPLLLAFAMAVPCVGLPSWLSWAAAGCHANPSRPLSWRAPTQSSCNQKDIHFNFEGFLLTSV